MRNYSINGQKFSTNLDANKIYEISRPIISYPYSFTNRIRTISQDFIVGTNNVPEYNPSLKHPIYNQAYITSQSEANVEPMGFCRFTRNYIEFLESEIIFPKNLSITYPPIFSTTHWDKRGISRTMAGMQNIDYMQDPIALRASPLSMVVPVEEKIELIYIGNGVRDTTTLPKDIPVGGYIEYQTYTWYINSNNNGVVELTRTDEEGDEVTTTASLNQNMNNYNYYTYDPDFTKIAPDYKYAINDIYVSKDSGVTSANQIATTLNPHATEVDFIDDATAPNYNGYYLMCEEKTKVVLQTSTFEHLGGYVYMKKTIIGNLR